MAAEDKTNKLLKMKEQIDQAKSKADWLRGTLEQLEGQLKQYGVKTLAEAKRVLKKDGLICISFATWFSPSGSHLNDWIYIPWNNVFFSEKTLIKVLKQLSLSEKYIAFQFPNINNETLPIKLEDLGAGNLNKITLMEFGRIVKKTGMKIKLFNLGMNSKNPTLNLIFKVLSKIPFINEFFGGEMAIVLQK